MSRSLLLPLLIKSLVNPSQAFTTLSELKPSPTKVIFSYTLWLLLLPPIFSWYGAYTFGWRLGGSQPLRLSADVLTLISIAYFVTLGFGLITTAVISRWMASTYEADDSFGLHVALITVVGTPLAVASAAHLFPHVFFNVVVMIPAIMWSMYLLYKGIPLVLHIPPERGMLMASALVGWLLVAAVSLLGITMALWANGFGPKLAV